MQVVHCVILAPIEYVPNSFGDRFIPRRYALRRSSQFVEDSKMENVTDPIKMKDVCGFWRHHHYTTVLKELFELVPFRNKILTFHEKTCRRVSNPLAIRTNLEWVTRPAHPNRQKLDWSCNPRLKPMAFIEAVHDLPNIKRHYQKIIDWSSGGQIAAIFNKKLVIWEPNTDVTIGLGFQHATAIAFNPTGDRLAIAMYFMDRAILDILEVRSEQFGKHGVVKIVEGSEVLLTCLTWDGSGRYVVCGFACGMLSVVDVQTGSGDGTNHRSVEYPAHNSLILMIKFSCGFKYLATGDLDGEVYIWSWSAGQLAVIKHMIASFVFFDWHPWREDEIVIADSEPVLISLHHVPSRQVVSYYRREEPDCIVTALSFNKVSGELVVCFTYADDDKQPEIVVLASLDRVVDVLRNHEESIVHLLWSPDGKQLASIGHDETLTIWNFFGSPPNGNTRGKNRKRKLQHDPPAGTSSGLRDVARIQCNRNKEATYRDLASSFLFKPMR
ncbi:protein cortex-like [Anopheles coustani]|uniref:protein cortex-like n=1 Tax=Anopheles coustani TaxID=139045 RepID=UPI002659C579|nr:protein cortex-like [Anopheles coustani]